MVRLKDEEDEDQLGGPVCLYRLYPPAARPFEVNLQTSAGSAGGVHTEGWGIAQRYHISQPITMLSGCC